MQTVIQILAVIGGVSVMATVALLTLVWVDDRQSRRQSQADDAVSQWINSGKP